MDKLDITGLTLSTIVGVHAWEQQIRQNIFIDMTIFNDFSAIPDELSHTIDYEKLCQHVTTYVESNQFALIETIANQVAELIKTDFGVKQLTVTVSKPHAIKSTKNISVTVNR